MNPIKRLADSLSRRSRRRRSRIFREHFTLTPQTRILDLGSETGAHISSVLQGSEVQAQNVYIADIQEAVVQEGQRTYGFTPVVIPESGELPFPDEFFDIVFCSSVIEHVTIPKKDVWTLRGGRAFEERAFSRQAEFAREVIRLGQGFFVQTPYKWFVIESHTLLPFMGWLPRRVLIPAIRVTNRVWLKTTAPDWHLLTKREMAGLFPGARIVCERVCGLTKSLMAIRNGRSPGGAV